MPDRDPSAWKTRLEHHRRPPPDDLHDTRGHWRMKYGDTPAYEYRCASCRTPWPCPDVATRMQQPLTRDELTELERRVSTRDYDPGFPHRAAGYAWDTALELFCAYVALDRDHQALLARVTQLQTALDTAHMLREA